MSTVIGRTRLRILATRFGGGVMVRTIKAKFANGVFEPLEPTALAEGAEVMITISTPSDRPTDGLLQETSGGWHGLIDAERFKRDVYADRLIATRPPVALWASPM